MECQGSDSLCGRLDTPRAKRYVVVVVGGVYGIGRRASDVGSKALMVIRQTLVPGVCM
jgi:hypothetical protein